MVRYALGFGLVSFGLGTRLFGGAEVGLDFGTGLELKLELGSSSNR